MDGEFEKIKSLVPSVECNTTTAKKHVSEAKQTIRMVKERTQGLLATLPFTHIQKRMKIEFGIFYDTMDECVPGQVGNIADNFAT